MSDAYRTCLRIASAHYENFPVASRLLPRSMRPHVAAVYAFARTADDIADEPGREPGERLALLDDWRSQLHESPRGDIFVALADTRAKFNLPIELFEDLLSAFRQDVTKTRYETWEELFDYSRRSANPVGRLVLRMAGHRRDELDEWSDAVCTALQFTNFWQDFAVDWRRGRLYLPADVWRPKGADTSDLDQGVLPDTWKGALADASSVTRNLFDQGRPVCDAVHGRLRYELRATWLGGVRILHKLNRDGFDVFRSRPTLTAADLLVIGWNALTRWPATPPSTTRS